MIKLKKTSLGGTGYKISKIGLGTVQFGIDYGFTKKKSQEEVNEILQSVINNDINLIDTAREYGDSEEKIGQFISQNKNDFIIATKLKKIPKQSKLNFNIMKDHIYRSLEESMNHLRLQKIHLLQLHQTNDYIIQNADFWKVIEQLRVEKIIGAFGVSVYDTEETKYIIKHYHRMIDFVQVPYNIFDRRFAELEDSFLKYSIGVISRSTFLKGLIPCSLNKIPAGLERILPYKIRLNQLAEELSMDAEKIALLFVYFNHLLTSTILGVDSSKELEENINIIHKYNENILTNKKINQLSVTDLTLIDPRKWSNF